MRHRGIMTQNARVRESPCGNGSERCRNASSGIASPSGTSSAPKGSLRHEHPVGSQFTEHARAGVGPKASQILSNGQEGSMNRYVSVAAMVAVAIALAACDRGATSPKGAMNATFDLKSISGTSLPYDKTLGTTTMRITSDILVLKENG